MKTIDLTPAMIGKLVTIKREDLHRSGRLNDLTVRTVNEGTMVEPHLAYLTGITVQIGGDHIELNGREELVVAE